MDEPVRAKLKPADGSLMELSHGRTCLRISGPKAEWVLSKLYAIDFSVAAFPAGTGLSTSHHSIFTQIYRHDGETFDLFVFPGERHGYQSPQAKRHAAERVVDYFARNL